jgi:hypothetical protein
VPFFFPLSFNQPEISMNKPYAAPADFSDEPYVAIPMTPVESNQVGAVGYDADTKTLAVTFKRGAGAIYHYPNVEPEQHAAFLKAESIGKHFGAHVKDLPFKKFPSPMLTESTKDAAAQPA